MADPTAIARDFVESWNRRDWPHIRELMHKDYSYTGGDGKVQPGIDAGMAIAQMFASAFPDGRMDLKNVYACGANMSIFEFTGRGTHKGELMGMAPTGRQVNIPVCNVIEVRDGKIVAEREYFDMMTMLQQLGLAPTAAGASAKA